MPIHTRVLVYVAKGPLTRVSTLLVLFTRSVLKQQVYMYPGIRVICEGRSDLMTTLPLKGWQGLKALKCRNIDLSKQFRRVYMYAGIRGKYAPAKGDDPKQRATPERRIGAQCRSESGA